MPTHVNMCIENDVKKLYRFEYDKYSTFIGQAFEKSLKIFG